jgi:aryl-alcohol dehydrogenase-like predicted oxidoreductase
MQYRQLGDSELKTSAIIVGTWAIGGWMWGGTDSGDAIDALKAAVDEGMTTIDTAPVYGFGLSEELVGKALAGRRDKVQLYTKYGLRWDREEGEFYFESPDQDGTVRKVYRNARKASVIEECEQSLKRLGTDYIDLYQCHWRDHTTEIDETMAAMEKLHKDGKIRAAGVSNFTVEEIAAARACFPVASVQPPYSMVRRDIEEDLLPYCRENNVGVIVYSPLQLGLLTGKLTMDRTFPEDDQRSGSPFFKAENRRRVIDFLEDIRPIAEAHSATIAQLVIQWTISRPGVTAALVGSRNPGQARENAAAADLSLSEDERNRINERLDDLKLDL